MNGVGRVVITSCFSLLAAACGRKGALISPDMPLPAPPAAATGQQSGSAVKIQFVLPGKDMSGRQVKDVAGVKIRRMESEPGKDVCRSCLADYQLLRTLYLDHLPTDTQRFGNRLIILDGDVEAGRSYSYSLVQFTADGADGASAAISDVRVVPPFSAPHVTIESFPTEIRLQFVTPQPLSGRLLGYNVYRSTAASGRSFQPLNTQLLKGNEFSDSTLERAVKYRYSARLIVEMTAGSSVESLESAAVEGMLKDDE
jgi:predicted small lipoprotein YifL